MKIAVTGAAGDFGTAILRLLLPDERVEEIIALDLAAPRLEHPKLRPKRCDVRDPRLGDLISGCEAVVHLAFVLVPGRDVARAHEINLTGSRNVLEAAAAAGASRLVVASSLSAYGAPEKGLEPMTEETFPGGTAERFYFREKAQVEHLLDWWEHAHLHSEMTITRLRPGFVYGPDFDNPALRVMGGPVAILPDDDGRTQLIHQEDLARAFCEAAFRDARGPFLIVTEDSISAEELAEISGGRVVRVPVRAAEVALDLAHALRISGLSSDWAVSGDRVGTLGRAREVLGWEPSLSSRESAYVLLLQRGRPVRYLDGPPRREVLERALEVPTGFIREGLEHSPGLAGVDLDAALVRARHEFVGFRGLRVHLEVHEAGPGAPTIVVHHGLGDHARRFTPLAARLAAEGINSVLVDRPGHGLSEGRRGHCPLEWALEVIELSLRFTRSEFAGPVVLLGDSLGGRTVWYALTREPDADAAICHTIGHPDVHDDAGMRWKAPLLSGSGRLFRHAPIPIHRLADYDHVALDPRTQAYFDQRVDRLFNFTVSAGTVASYLGFEPDLPWEQVTMPVLVIAGEADRLTPKALSEAALERSRPPRTTYLPLPGAGHQVFLDHLNDVFPKLVEWTRGALTSGAPRARLGS